MNFDRQVAELQNRIGYSEALIEELRVEIGDMAVKVADARAKLKKQASYAAQLEATCKTSAERIFELESNSMSELEMPSDMVLHGAVVDTNAADFGERIADAVITEVPRE